MVTQKRLLLFVLVGAQSMLPMHAIKRRTIEAPSSDDKVLNTLIHASKAIPLNVQQYLSSFTMARSNIVNFLLHKLPSELLITCQDTEHKGQRSEPNSEQAQLLKKALQLDSKKDLWSFSRNEETLVTSKNQKSFSIWGTQPSQLIFSVDMYYPHTIEAIMLSDDDTKVLVYVSYDDGQHAVMVYDVTTRKCILKTDGYFEMQTKGDHLLIHSDHCVHCWNMTTSKRIFSLPEIDEAYFNQDGSRILTDSCSNDDLVRLWNGLTGELLLEINCHESKKDIHIFTFNFNENGSQFFTYSRDLNENYLLEVWDTETGRNLATVPDIPYLSRLALNRDGTQLRGELGSTVVIFTIDTYTQLKHTIERGLTLLQSYVLHHHLYAIIEARANATTLSTNSYDNQKQLLNETLKSLENIHSATDICLDFDSYPQELYHAYRELPDKIISILKPYVKD